MPKATQEDIDEVIRVNALQDISEEFNADEVTLTITNKKTKKKKVWKLTRVN
jgi:hypothetical protein